MKIKSFKLQRTIGLVTAGLVFFSFSAPTLADQFDSQINSLKQQIASQQSQADALKGQSDTLQGQVSNLDNQISQTTNQIYITQAQLDKATADINAAQQQLEQQKDFLDENLRQLYLDGQTSTLEALVSSGGIGDFLDRQEALQSVKDKIESSLDQIKATKAKLEDKQKQLTDLQLSQQAQQRSLNNARAQQADLLAQTQGQEANYQSLVASNNKKLQEVYAERAALDAANHVGISVGGTGGYPYAGSVPDSSDPWGFLTRECTSYVAWKRRAEGHAPYPLYWGNAGDWVYAAPNDSSPRAGDIAVFPPGVQGAFWTGHVAYVERVNGNGTVDLSEYNWRPYAYDYRSGVPAGGLRFIH